MKLAGLLIASAALLLTAFQTLSRQKKQLDTLRELCALLEQMAAELGERCTPLPELMDELAAGATARLRPFFAALCLSLRQLDEQRFSESWRQAVDRQLSLPDAAKAALCRLGGFLGRYSGELQRSAVLSTRSELLRELQRRESSMPDKRRLTLGLTAAMVAMLLILNL